MDEARQARQHQHQHQHARRQVSLSITYSSHSSADQLTLRRGQADQYYHDHHFSDRNPDASYIRKCFISLARVVTALRHYSTIGPNCRVLACSPSPGPLSFRSLRGWYSCIQRRSTNWILAILPFFNAHCSYPNLLSSSRSPSGLPSAININLPSVSPFRLFHFLLLPCPSAKVLL